LVFTLCVTAFKRKKYITESIERRDFPIARKSAATLPILQ